MRKFLKPILKKISKKIRIFTHKNYLKYYRQKSEFKKLGGIITHTYPILWDYDAEAGSANGHYFHQDLVVASYINKKNPIRHIDIGSRIDGFVAHVASFRKIEIIDVRELKSLDHNNISFIKADLMNAENAKENITDSISCLHAIEHFGLGRYNEPLDPNGHKKAFENIIKMLKIGGSLYISFPIANSNEVHFNAHRVFNPKDIFVWSNHCKKLKLENFDYVDDSGNLHRNINLDTEKFDLRWGCGIYSFTKIL